MRRTQRPDDGVERVGEPDALAFEQRLDRELARAGRAREQRELEDELAHLEQAFARVIRGNGS